MTVEQVNQVAEKLDNIARVVVFIVIIVGVPCFVVGMLRLLKVIH